MTGLRTIASLCAISLLATGVAACGAATPVSTSAFQGEQRLIAQTIAHLQSHAAALEAKKICGEDLAAARVAQLNSSPGGCKRAIESQLKEIDSFETTVESVQIDGGAATTRVKSIDGGKNSPRTVTLVKEGGKWKVSGVS